MVNQGSHLSDGDLVELCQSFLGGDALANQHGIDAFQIGKDNELLHGGVISHIALEIGSRASPLFGGDPE